jgi:hypothetical protein
LSRMLYYPYLVSSQGLGTVPVPAIGWHWVIFVTYAAAFITGMLRAVRQPAPGSDASVVNGLLGYTSVFGIGISVYFVRRAVPIGLVLVFGAWALCLCVVGWETVRALARERSRSTRALLWIPAVAAGSALVAGGLQAFRPPSASAQIERIKQRGPNLYDAGTMRAFVASHTRRGESVCIIAPLSHRVAEAAHVQDVFPFDHPAVMSSRPQLDLLRSALRHNHITKLFSTDLIFGDAFAPSPQPELEAMIRLEGYVPSLQEDSHRSFGALYPGVQGNAHVILWTKASATAR